MLPILEFVFSTPWTFAGFVLLFVLSAITLLGMVHQITFCVVRYHRLSVFGEDEPAHEALRDTLVKAEQQMREESARKN